MHQHRKDPPPTRSKAGLAHATREMILHARALLQTVTLAENIIEAMSEALNQDFLEAVRENSALLKRNNELLEKGFQRFEQEEAKKEETIQEEKRQAAEKEKTAHEQPKAAKTVQRGKKKGGMGLHDDSLHDHTLEDDSLHSSVDKHPEGTAE